MDLRTALSAFVPRSLWNTVNGGETEKRVQGSVLFADLAGFTQLTDSLASIGKEGAEELTRILNDFFSAMIRIVHMDGGDVIRFGGDAMTIFIPKGPEEALKSAIRLQAETRKYQKVETRAGVFALGMKIGISYGMVVFSQVGGDEVGYDYFAAGRTLDFSAESEHRAKQGQIVLCPEANAGLDAGKYGIMILDEGFGLLEDPSLFNEMIAGPSEAEPQDEIPSEENLMRFLPSYIEDKLKQRDEQLVGEHRRTTVLFLSFKGLDYDGDPGAVATASLIYNVVARLSSRYGGVVNKIDMGDKGSKVLALFGSPLALEHQEEMGCRCALDIISSPELKDVISNVKIGITVSSVFSAYVGCSERREYTVMGNGINLAARLMSNAPYGGVLVSEEIYEKAGHAVDFEVLEPINVKGKKEKVPIFSPRKTKGSVEVEEDFVGRTKEFERVLGCIKDPAHQSNIAVTGAAGVGKSVFLNQLKKRSENEGFECIFTRLASYDRDKFFGAWRGIVFHCLGIETADEKALSVERISSELDEEDRAYVPLFKDIIQMDIPENNATKALSSKDRKDIFFAIVSRLVLKKTADHSHCIFIDHLDYADPSSIEFLSEIATDIRGTALRIVVSFRDIAAASLKEVTENFETITIEPFTADEVREYLVSIGGFAPPAETFVNFLLSKTGGNPKFLGEVLLIMKHENLAFRGPSELLEVDEDRLSSASFPDTLQGLFLSRVENLEDNERQLLKSASILGPSFSIESLAALMGDGVEQVSAKVAQMEPSGLIKLDTWGTRPYASFTDSLLRDALYDSLNYQIKRELHKKVAESLESWGVNEPRINPVLARHYENAGEEEKALLYLWKSAEYSRSLYDNRSAYDHLGRYVAISEKRGSTSSGDKNFLDALMYFADVQQELGRIPEADALYTRILEEIKEVGQDTVKATSRLADNKRRTGCLKESLELFDKALEGAKQLKDEALQCRIFLDSGVPLAMTGKMGKAMDHFQRAENIAAKIEDFPSLVYALMNRGLVEYFKGKLEGAKSLLNKAREVAKEHDLKSYLALITVNLAQVHFEMGEYEKALTTCKEAVEVSRQFGYRNHLVLAMANQALYETMLGDFNSGMVSAEKALLSAKHYGMTSLVAANLHTESLLWFKDGCFTNALNCQRMALQTHISVNHCGEALSCLSEIIAIANYLKMPQLAEKNIEENMPKLQNETQNITRTWTIGFMANHVFHQLLLGELDSYDAIDKMENILERARESGILWLVADVGNVLLKIFQSDGNHEKAAENGMDLFPLLSTHRCPLILPRFLMTLANSLIETDAQEDLSSVLECLRTYEKFLDKGPFGLEYSILLYRVAKNGDENESKARLADARRLIEEIRHNEEDEEIVKAFFERSVLKEQLPESQ